jgi:hypothetical protein
MAKKTKSPKFNFFKSKESTMDDKQKKKEGKTGKVKIVGKKKK